MAGAATALVAARPIAADQPWWRGITLAMSAPDCVICHGAGSENGKPCRCATKAVFKACLRRYHQIEENRICGSVSVPRKMLNGAVLGSSLRTDFVGAEFRADFERAVKMAVRPRWAKLFWEHYILGVPIPSSHRWVSSRLIEQQARVGWYLMSLQPYALYPIDEYFSRRARKKEKTVE